MQISFTQHLRAFALVLLFSFAATAFGNPVITEFMADNTSTLQDEDGAYSDWIEIHNPTAAPIDLNNWCLTDSASDLDQWRFPAVTIQPGEFIVVWASGKDKRVPGQPLHTNFALAAGGEYLALVRPDGTTIQQQFAPKYPALDKNESYGAQFTSTNLLSSGAAARYFVPTNNTLGTTWTAVGFNHNSWSTGPTGLGFGLLVPGITVREVAMNGTFGTVTSVATADALLAQPQGSAQIASESTAIFPTVNFLGNGSDGHYGANQISPNGGGDNYVIRATGSIIIPTAGVYTFGLNSDDGGRIKIDGANVMVDDSNHGASDHVGTVNLTAGSHTFDVMMWEQGGGDEVEFYAAPGSFAAWNVSMQLVGDTANGGLAAFTLPNGVGSSVISTNIDSAMRNVSPSCYVRVPFTGTGPGSFTSLSLKMRYNDGFVAYLNGTLAAQRNAPGSPINSSVATASRTDAESLVVSPSNLTALLPQLQNGSNVLAIHGLNISTGDGSFLVLPELVAGTLSGSADYVFFDQTKSTPAAINGAYSLLGKVEDTKFSVNRGFFSAPFSLQITTTTPGATIRYTTDGSTPTASTGIVYTSALNITGTTVIRAAAFKTGFLPTNIDTQTYLFVSDVISQSSNGVPPAGWPATSGTSQVLDYGMDPDIVNNANSAIGGQQVVRNSLTSLSAISIVTDLPNLFNMNGSQGIYSNPGGRGFSWERPCSMELINPPDASNPNGTSEFQVNCGVRIRGGFSRSTDNPKHSFHMYFRGDYGPGKLNYPLFGRFGTDEFDQFDLRTSQNYSWAFGGDSRNTMIREESTRVAQLEMGQLSSHVRYFHLFINGQYWGLFDTDERTEASFMSTYLGGSKDDYDVVKCEQDSGYTVGSTDGTLEKWNDLWTKSRAHAASPTNANYFRMMGLAADGVTPTADPVLLDVDNLIDYMLLTFWTGNLDGATSAFLGNNRANNWFGARRRTGTQGFKFFAHDFEHTFLNNAEDRTGPFIDAAQNDFSYSNPMYLHQDLMGNAEYQMRFADRTQKHLFNNGALTAAAWTARVNNLATIIDSAIIAESARWGDAKTATPLNRNDWLNAKNSLIGGFGSRGNTVIGQLRADSLFPSIDAPTMTPFGGYLNAGSEVVLSASAGTIYYMPDGSDPRLLGGGIKPGAQIYTSATTNETLISAGAVWKYKDDGSNQGTAWRQAGFNDASWASGPAELGYGDNDEATRVEDNPTPGYNGADTNRYATTYFRRTFSVTNANEVTGLTLSLKYDDQAIVYINGAVAVNTGMPTDPAFDFYSSGTPDETVFFTFNPPASLLINGTNTIAVEVHQLSASSSDMSFNLSLVASRSSTPTPYFITGNGERPLKVRAYSSGTWSALSDALFLVDTEPASASNLAISQIMYHPAAPSSAEIAEGFEDADDFEFLEFTNVGGKNVDLMGLYLYGPISFDFSNSLVSRILPPGGRVLIVAKRSAFEFRYGTGKPVAGSYSGHLSNSSEQIILFPPSSSSPVINVTYADDNGWPGEADGAGYSLVYINPGSGSNPNDPTSWRGSVNVGGSPGASDAQTYPAWKSANGVLDDNADPEGDGFASFAEYAFGGRPTIADPLRRPRVGVMQADVSGTTGTYATITFSRRFATDDTDYIVEGATNLNPANWSAASVVLVGKTRQPDGTETLVYRSTQPTNTGGGQYLRVRSALRP